MSPRFAISCLLGAALLFSGAQETKPSARAFLGVHVKNVPEEVRAQTELAEGDGLLIDFLQSNSPAVNAGLKVHDILVNFDDQKLVSSDQLAHLIKCWGSGKQVKLGMIRKGKPVEVIATLGEAPISTASAMENGPAADDSNELLRKNPEAAKMLQDLINRLGRTVPEIGSKLPTNVTSPNVQAKSMHMSDGEGSVEISIHEGHRKVIVKDASGMLLYQGELNTAEDRGKLAPEIRCRVEKLEQSANAVRPAP